METPNNRASRRLSSFQVPVRVIDLNRGSWPVLQLPVGQVRPGSGMYLPPTQALANDTWQKNPLERIDSGDSSDSVEPYKKGGVVQVEEQQEDQVLGSTELYDKDGNLRLVPVRLTCIYPPFVYPLTDEFTRLPPQIRKIL